jgi:hypothetical protein
MVRVVGVYRVCKVELCGSSGGGGWMRLMIPGVAGRGANIQRHRPLGASRIHSLLGAHSRFAQHE